MSLHLVPWGQRTAPLLTLEQLVEAHEALAIGEQLEEHVLVELDLLREHGPWIQTRSGRAYPLLAPRPEDVDLADIAYALAGIARFTGHAERQNDHSYNVAQHSVLASYEVPEAHAFEGLMHDAAEAYVGDCSAPMKACLPQIAMLERISYLAIARRYDLPLVPSLSVKQADLLMLATEKRDLMVPEPKPWLPLPGPLSDVTTVWSASQSERAFVRRFHQLHVPKLRTVDGAGERR